MIPIHPISEDNIKRHCGLPVCAVLQDGTRHYGMLSRVDGGQLYLNEDAPVASEVAFTSDRKKKGKASSSKKASVSQWFGGPYGYGGFGGYGYGRPFGFGGRIALDIAAIALLFALVI